MIKNSLNKKLKHLTKNILTIVCAPNGSGKTSSIKQYLQESNTMYMWANVNCSDDVQVIWEELIDFALQKEYGPRVLSGSQCPKTIQQCQAILDVWDTYLKQHLVIVIDDYEDQSCEHFTNFLCVLSRCESRFVHFIVVTAMLQDFQLLKIYEESNAKHFNARDFQLNEMDIQRLAKQKKIALSKQEINEISTFTSGWLPAIDIALRSIQNGGTIYTTSGLNELMHNIHFKQYSEEVKEGLMKLSILKEFTLEQAYYICESKATIRELDYLEANKIYIKKKDFQSFRFTPLFSEFLKQALIVSEIDYQFLYRKAGNWFLQKGDSINALTMYLEGNHFIDIIHLIEHNEYSLIHKVPKLMVEIFKRMPKEYKYYYPYVYLMHIYELITNVDSTSGKKLLERFYTDLKRGKYQEEDTQLLAEYYLICAVCQFNDNEKMLKYFHLAYKTFGNRSSKVAYPRMIASFGSCHLLYLYHNKLGNLKNLVDIANHEATKVAMMLGGVTSGFEYQVQAEYLFTTGAYEQVIGYAEVAYKEAYLHKQTSICICSLFVQARCALLLGDKEVYIKAVSKLRELHKNVSLEILKHELDCALAYLYLVQNHCDYVADWIVEGDVSDVKIMHEAWAISFVMMILYHLKQEDYDKVKICCDIAELSLAKKNQLLGLLFVHLGRSVLYFRIDDEAAAFAHWEKAMEIAKADHIVSVFIEFYDLLFEVFEAVPKKDEYALYLWDLVKSRKRKERKTNPFAHLTNKEMEVVALFVDSMTAKEVADSLVLSENTVRTHVKNVYAKLDITKKTELVQLYEQYKKY